MRAVLRDGPAGVSPAKRMRFTCKYNQGKRALEVGRRNTRFNVFLTILMGILLAAVACHLYVLIGMLTEPAPQVTHLHYLRFGLSAGSAVFICAALVLSLRRQQTFYFKPLDREVLIVRGVFGDHGLERTTYDALDFCEYKLSRYPLPGHLRLVLKDGRHYWIARHVFDIEVIEAYEKMTQFGVPARWVKK
jgi:hypothetical protein